MEIYEAAISDFNALLHQWQRDSKLLHLDDRRKCSGAINNAKLVEATLRELFFRGKTMKIYYTRILHITRKSQYLQTSIIDLKFCFSSSA